MDFLKNLITFFNYTNTDKLDKHDFGKLPIHFYCKDLKGRLIDTNKLQAYNLGFDKETDVLGYTALDLDPAHASGFAKNDINVISTKKSKIIIESVTIIKSRRLLNSINGYESKTLSYKIPIRLRTGKIIGLSGISLPLINENITFNHYKLSMRQKECLFFLVRGKSDKEIGKILRLSPRTVESYVNEIKYKMGCYNRSQVIEKAFSEGMIDIISNFSN